MSAEQEIISVFQFHSKQDYPVYLTVQLGHFESGLTGFLSSLGFDMMANIGEEGLKERLKDQLRPRVLRLELAGAKVAQQIKATKESDRYGGESMIPQQGYRVYRYHGRALMMMSFAAEEWRAGVFSDFGTDQCLCTDRVIINRYLSWALSSLGVVGFWGQVQDNKLVMMKPGEAQGLAVFIDWSAGKYISEASAEAMPSDFEIIRLNHLARGRDAKIGKEELLSALTVHCTFFSFDGLSTPVRQVLQSIAQTIPGRSLKVVATSMVA